MNGWDDIYIRVAKQTKNNIKILKSTLQFTLNTIRHFATVVGRMRRWKCKTDG